MIGSMTESFPRQQARTRRFTLGVPRGFQVSPDGGRVTFLRSRAGDDPVTCLWEADAATGQERVVADPRALGADEENLPPEERARRERVRETHAGIVAYATDADATLAVFALSGQVYTVPLGVTLATGSTPAARLLPVRAPALDPRLDPTGTKVAYVHDGALRVIDLETEQDAVVAQEEGVTFGLAEFVAAEEMHRSRGYWWSPDGRRLLVERVDESPVARWHIADPANPGTAPVEVSYPAAGTANANVSLLVATLPGPAATRDEAARIAQTPLAVISPAGTRLAAVAGWDRDAFPYLVNAAWGDDLLIVVQTRDQKTMRVINAVTGAVLREDTDPHWTDVIDGVPAQLPGGDIVWTGISGDTRGLVIAPAAELATAGPLTPAGLQVHAVIGTDGGDVLFAGSAESTELGIWRYGPAGLTAVSTEPGVHSAQAGGGTTVLSSRTLASSQVTVRITRGGAVTGDIASLARRAEPAAPGAAVHRGGPGRHPHRRAVPVVVLPGYPAAGAHVPLRRARARGRGEVRARLPGLAVVRRAGVRGRGGGRPRHAGPRARVGPADRRRLRRRRPRRPGHRPGRGGGEVHRPGHDPGRHPRLVVRRLPVGARRAAPPGRVPRRGRGGPAHRLAALRHALHRAVPRRPQRAAGCLPAQLAYRRPRRAVQTQVRPLLIIHGLADDNVFVAHSLRLSSALLAAGYPHSVLPLSGITHMTSQETVAENMLLLQVAFLKQALGLSATAG